MPTRILIDPQGTALPCENCGYPALHVAQVVDEDGVWVGRTMVCTACRRRQHRETRQGEERP